LRTFGSGAHGPKIFFILAMPLFKSLVSKQELTASKLKEVSVVVSRILLQKKRWRSVADNGDEVAIDFDQTVKHGDCIGVNGSYKYIIFQELEEVIVIPIPENSIQSTTLGWMLGNQHLPIQVKSVGEIILSFDSGVRMFLERNQIEFALSKKRFLPSPHSHTHTHG
jgi:urease accessory protein UreE